MEDRIKQLEETNERLLLELGYLQGEVSKLDDYKRRITELEFICESHRVRENRAWDRYHDAINERDSTRTASMEAIRLLQVELERERVNKATQG